MTTFQAPFFCTFWDQSLSGNRKLIISGLSIAHSHRYLVQSLFLPRIFWYLLETLSFPGLLFVIGVCAICRVPCWSPGSCRRGGCGEVQVTYSSCYLRACSMVVSHEGNLWGDVDIHHLFTKILLNTLN